MVDVFGSMGRRGCGDGEKADGASVADGLDVRGVYAFVNVVRGGGRGVRVRHG